jgi:hypothetical protein
MGGGAYQPKLTENVMMSFMIRNLNRKKKFSEYMHPDFNQKFFLRNFFLVPGEGMFQTLSIIIVSQVLYKLCYQH